MSESKEEIVTEEKPAKKKCSGALGLVAMFVLLAAVAGGGGVGYYQLHAANQRLAQEIQQLKNQSGSEQQGVSALQQTIADLQKSVAENSKQQAEQKIWPVMQAYYLTSLAKTYLQLTQNSQQTTMLLQSANDLLQQVPDTEVLRQALGSNLANLQTASAGSIESYYLQMAGIYNQLDNLQLTPTLLEPKKAVAETPVVDEGASWWHKQWLRSVAALQKVVIVRYDDGKELPVIMPEEKMFVYQNLHAQMEAAMLGLLQHNQGVYQVSLARLSSWIKKYFVQDAPLTVDLLQQLQNLQAIKLQAPDVNIDMTLQAFQQFLAQNNHTQIVAPQPEAAQEAPAATEPVPALEASTPIQEEPVTTITVPAPKE